MLISRILVTSQGESVSILLRIICILEILEHFNTENHTQRLVIVQDFYEL